MNKGLKNSLLILIVTICLFVIIYIVYDIIKEKPVDANIVSTNLEDENTGLDNIINELFENVEVNTLNEQLYEAGEEPKSEDKTEPPTESITTTETVTSREEKAIELVKKEWGGTDGVYFSNESIDQSGRYIVSVRNSRTTSLLAFYIVDVNTGIVTKK